MDIIMFWYALIITWLLLGLSVIFFIISLIKKSQKLMFKSIICMIPNVIFVLMEDIEIIILYSFLLWFALQFFMLSKLIKKESLKSVSTKRDAYASRFFLKKRQKKRSP